MSPRTTPKSRKLVLNRDTIRNLEDQAAVRFGPHTSETEACCPSIVDTAVDTVIRTV